MELPSLFFVVWLLPIHDGGSTSEEQQQRSDEGGGGDNGTHGCFLLLCSPCTIT